VKPDPRTWAVRYLERFPCSRAGFIEAAKRSMTRMRMRGQPVPDVDLEVLAGEMERAGLLDDDAYTKALVRSLRNQGKARRAIEAKLRQKRVPEGLAREALSELDDAGDLEAAWETARKKRLGPYRVKERDERRQKDLAAMARRGFSFDIARRVIDAESPR
jgi:regulatory protein